MDPDYNYLEKVPKQIKYRKKSNMFDTMYTIEDNLTRTAGILITGEEDCPSNNNKKDLRIGDSTYFESGKCSKNSTNECIDKPRHIIVDNLPFDQKGNKGLIPSIINDVTYLEPIEIVNSINGRGSIVNDKCSMKNVDVIQINPGSDLYKRTANVCVSDITLPVIKTIESFKSKNTEDACYSRKLILTIILLSFLLALNRSR